MADLGSLLGSAGIGGAIGQAVVRLELDTKKYLGEMKAAEGQTVASTNAMGTSTSKFAGLAQTALLGAGVAAVAFAAVSVKAAIEANSAHLKLQNTFANNAMLADSSVEAFEAQADSLRDLTGVDDEAIISAQALAGSFKLTGQQVLQLMPLIVDLSEKRMVDLETATKAVAKSTQGSTAGLLRMGVQVDATKAQTDAFGATLDALAISEGFAAKQAELEPWRLIGAQFEEIEEQLGQALLPALESLVPALLELVDALGPLLDLLGKLGPVLEIVAKGFKIILSPLAAVIDLIQAGVEPTGEMTALLGTVAEKQLAAQAAANKLASSQKDLADSTDKVTASMREQIDAILSLADSTFGLITAVRDNKDAERELAQAHERVNRLQREGKTDTAKYAEAQRDLRDKALAAAQSQGDLSGAVRRLQQEIADGKTSRQEAIGAIRDLGKEAGLTGKDIRGLVDDIKGGLNDAAATAKRLAPGIGRDISSGISSGILAGSGGMASAATRAVQLALAAARAAADAKSPSKKMHELGVDMMVGLANGISDAEQKAIDAARTALEKTIDQASSALDKIQGKASSFRDTIRGAFSGFLDIGGAFGQEDSGSISAILATQVSGAFQLADILNALKAQGASKATLGQVAGAGAEFGQALLQGGPALVEEMNQSLKTISELANQTGKGLSEAFFGDKIDKVEKKLDQLHEDLRELNKLEREGHSHDIILNGEKVSESTRKDLIRTGSRNPDIFGGRA